MGKLTQHKQWHTLESAAHHLASEFNEPVTTDDIIQFAAQGTIRLSYKFYPDDYKGKRISQAALAFDLEEQSITEIDRFNELQATEPYVYIQGVFKLPDTAPYFRKWLLGEASLPCYSDFIFVGYDTPSFGLIIEDLQGIKYQLITRNHRKDFPDYSEGPDPYGDYDIKKSELIVCHDDLERFISTTKELESQPVKIRTTESTLIDALGLMAIALSETNSRLKHGDRPNASKLAEHVEQIAGRLGLEFESNSNLERDISTAIKQVRSNSKTLP